MTIRDDAYDAPKAIENIDYFLNVLKISTLIAPVGTPTLESYLGKVKMSQLLVLFPLSGSDLFRSPDLKYIINFRCSYNYESYALARYAIETLHAKKIALFYQTTAPGIEGALKYFKEANFNDHFELNYNEQDVKFQEQARKIEQEKPDVLMLFPFRLHHSDYFKKWEHLQKQLNFSVGLFFRVIRFKIHGVLLPSRNRYCQCCTQPCRRIVSEYKIS